MSILLRELPKYTEDELYQHNKKVMAANPYANSCVALHLNNELNRDVHFDKHYSSTDEVRKKLDKELLSLSPMLIATGVIGVGKSTLMNILDNQQGRFEGKDTVTAGTTEIKSVQCYTDTRYHYLPFNLVDAPGQFDNSNEELHHLKLEEQVKQGNACFLFVVSPSNNGGRITDTDIETYNRLIQCFGVQPHSILGVVNRMEPTKEYKEDLDRYWQEHGVKVKEWLFVPNLDLKSDSHHELKRQFWGKINDLTPVHHRITKERETEVRLQKIKEDADIKQKKEADDHAAKLAEEKQQLERERVAELKRQADLAIEQAKIKEAVEAAQRQAQAEEAERQRQAAAILAAQQAANAALAAQQAEQARLQAIADAQPVVIMCEGEHGVLCHNTITVTAGHIRINCGGVMPRQNCKNRGHAHHNPRIKRR